MRLRAFRLCVLAPSITLLAAARVQAPSKIPATAGPVSSRWPQGNFIDITAKSPDDLNRFASHTRKDTALLTKATTARREPLLRHPTLTTSEDCDLLLCGQIKQANELPMWELPKMASGIAQDVLKEFRFRRKRN